MYEDFYQLSGDPFRLLPDPKVCLLHASHAHAWSYMQYALQRGEGIVIVSGIPGSGKTTLAERLLIDLNDTRTVSVRLVAHSADPTALFRQLAHAFGLEIDRLDDALLAFHLEQFLTDLAHSNRRALVIVDEAHTLSSEALEALRLLTDLQSNSKSVMQLFLLGHEELEMMMSAPRMAQIQQRVIASCRLCPMSQTETKAYLEYRLAGVDWQGTPAISGPAVAAIHRHSGGWPRQVNKICSRLFLYASAEEKRALTEQDVQTVVDDFCDELFELFTVPAKASPSTRRPDANEVLQLALVPLESTDTKRSGRPGVAALDVPRTGGRAHTVPDSRYPAARRPAATAVNPSIARISTDSVPPSVRPSNVKRASALTQKNRFGQASFMSAVRSLGIGVSHRVRSMAALARQSGSSARHWAKQQFRHRFTTLGQSTSRTMLLARQRLRAIIPRRPSEKLRQGTTGLAQVVFGNQRALVAVASIALVSIVVAVVFQGPKPQRDDAPENLAQPVPEPPAEMTTLTARYVTTGQIIGPAPPQPETAQKPSASSLLSDRSNANALSATAPQATSASTDGESPNGPEVVDQARAGNPSAEGSIAANDSTFTDTIGPMVSEPDKQAVEIRSATDDNGLFNLLAKGDPSDVLPAPAAGHRDNIGAWTRVTIRDSSAPMPMHNPYGSRIDGILQANSDAIVSRQLPEQGNVELELAAAPVSTPPASADSVSDNTEDIEAWLELANAALRRDHLLLPESDSAVRYFGLVLEQDAQHAEAIAGMSSVVDRYLVLAKSAFEKAELERAGRLVDRALRVSPNHTNALALRRDVADAVAEGVRQRQAEAARLAAEAAARAEAAEIAAAEAARQEELAQQRKASYELLWAN